MPFNVGPLELVLVLTLALLILGPGKLSEVGTLLGRTVRDLRGALDEKESELP